MMKVLQITCAVTLAGAMVAGNALAQGVVSQPQSVAGSSFEHDYYAVAQDEAVSPSDAPVAENGGGCASSCDNLDCCEHGVDCGEPWHLQRCRDNCWGIEWGGWLSAGISVNDEGVGGVNANTSFGFNNVAEEFDLHQAWFYMEKAVDTGGCGFDWGFRADFVYGVDGPDTQAFGDIDWDNSWDHSSNSRYGSALPQLYAEIGYNDLTVKVGHFFTVIGYEVVQAPDNFFFTHEYTHIYGEPFTHTGAIGTYAVSDELSVMGGWTGGWDGGFNNADDGSTFLGGFSYAINECTNFTYAVSAGDWGDGSVANTGDIYMHSLVLTHDLRDDLHYIFHSDYGNNDLGATHTEWYGAAHYLIYDINCCWALGARFEWFDDHDGARVGGTVADDAGDYYAVTLGVNWKPHTNLIIRPEVRFDWFEDDGLGAAFLPYINNTDDEMTTFNTDIIFLY